MNLSVTGAEMVQCEPEPEVFGADLQSEICDGRIASYDISVGSTEDVAYERPDRVAAILELLNTKGDQFSSSSAEVVGLYAEATTGAAASRESSQGTYERMCNRLDELRAELLFDHTKMPWHSQRGSALALQTIVDAHDLIAQDGPAVGQGLYPTMSGRLTFDSRDFSFGNGDGSLSGLGLSDAIMQTRRRLHGESEEVATRETGELLCNLDVFLMAPVTQDFKDIVAYCYDSLGIRSRNLEVSRAVLATMPVS